MSNTNRPGAPADCDCADRCTSCGCSECGEKVDRETLGPLKLPSGRVVWACPGCRADGIPVGVAEETTAPVESETRPVRVRTDAELMEDRKIRAI
jgi:hypothetical protein